MTQTNTQNGPISLAAGEDLAANLLVGIANSSGSPVAALPNSATDEVPFVTEEDTPSGDHAKLIPLEPGQNARVKLSGTCAPGDQIVVATPNGTVDGQVTKLPATPGTYRLIGVAEETGTNGQAVKIRPVGSRLITVTLLLILLGMAKASFAADADATTRERVRILSDTNSTTTVTAHSAAGAGQLLSGKAGGTNAVWLSTASGTNSWVKIAQQ